MVLPRLLQAKAAYIS